ncbi:MAG: replication initiator protein A [Butyrivibrio sp.]|nr:replication initiator protein A [Butyrivibrio sp.]
MSDALRFDYFYGIEADQYKHYRIPKLLVKHPRFKSLSSDAKLAYGLMLDRMSLSIKNRWLDDKKRAYIIYTLEEIADELGCSQDKATRVLAALDSKQGIGLIERVRRGLGKPDIIYVKNFMAVSGLDEDEYLEEEMNVPKSENEVGEEDEKEPANPCSSTDSAKCGFKKPQNKDSRIREMRIQETADYGFSNPQKTDSGLRKKRIQESAECGPNNTNNNYTDMSYTDSNHIDLSWGGRTSLKEKLTEKKGQIDRMDDIKSIQALIRKNIDYDEHMKYDTYDDREIYDEMYQLICDTVCVKRDTVKIGGQEYPFELVKSRFLKLDHFHLEYVRERMRQTTSDIGNIKNYLLTALYNAPATINHYYQQAVQHDLYGGGIG